MFNFLKSLLLKENIAKKATTQSSTPDNVDRTVSESKLDALELKVLNDLNSFVKGRGHKEFFCLSPLYSPGSRVPAVDFSPWIKQKIKNNDREPLRILLWELVKANPGSVAGDSFKPSWQQFVDLIMDAQVEKYVEVAIAETLLDLRTALFLISIDGAFIMTSHAQQYLSYILFPWDVNFLNVEILVKEANKFIREMRKDVDYWKSVPLFKFENLKIPKLTTNSNIEKLRGILREIPLNSRSHFFDICVRTDYGQKTGTKTAEEMSFFETRKRGLVEKESLYILVNAGLVIKHKDPYIPLKKLTKDEVISILQNEGKNYEQNWKKDMLIEKVVKDCPEYVDKLTESMCFATINPDFLESVQIAREYIIDTVQLYGLLLGFGIN